MNESSVEESSSPREPYNNDSTEQALTFRNQIQSLVEQLDFKKSIQTIHSFASVCEMFHAKRRRLYDVINVFSAIGLISRPTAYDIKWQGRDQIIHELLRQKDTYKVHNYKLGLNAIFPQGEYVSLSSLTVALLMLFPALEVDTIDLRFACSYFARNTSKYKTTLSKIYQIILILSALFIVQKTKSAGIKLLEPYSSKLIGNNEITRPESIAYLLNKNEGEKDECIRKRRTEFTNTYESCKYKRPFPSLLNSTNLAHIV